MIHAKSLRWLRESVQEIRANGEKFVIVTHHAPSARSLPPHNPDNLLNAAYASHLDEFIKASGAILWIHGHTHTQQNDWIGQTQIICNPRGYPDDRNENFIPNLVIEI
jgi:Icc-related predicted phosphoesterase